MASKSARGTPWRYTTPIGTRAWSESSPRACGRNSIGPLFAFALESDGPAQGLGALDPRPALARCARSRGQAQPGIARALRRPRRGGRRNARRRASRRVPGGVRIGGERTPHASGSRAAHRDRRRAGGARDDLRFRAPDPRAGLGPGLSGAALLRPLLGRSPDDRGRAPLATHARARRQALRRHALRPRRPAAPPRSKPSTASTSTISRAPARCSSPSSTANPEIRGQTTWSAPGFRKADQVVCPL